MVCPAPTFLLQYRPGWDSGLKTGAAGGGEIKGVSHLSGYLGLQFGFPLEFLTEGAGFMVVVLSGR